MQKRITTYCLLLLSLFALTLTLSPTLSANSAPNSTALAPLIMANQGTQIPDQYIVVFKDKSLAPNLRATAENAIRDSGGTILREYHAALNGLSMRLAPDAVARLRQNPNIAFIEQDQRVSITDGTLSQAASAATDNTVETNPDWGLDRIDQHNLPLDHSYTFYADGSGVSAYVIDTGIRLTHHEFAGRAFSGYDAVGDGNGTNDCAGHGTHVAGTIGGTAYGVAKNVKLYAVRVLDCKGSGYVSGVIAGVDWVTANATLPAVANMSLAGGLSAALDNAITNSINSGIFYAVAAGNDSANACYYSPADTTAAVTVGATDNADERAYYSNYGSCLDIFAPGSAITSAWFTSDTAKAVLSGTSMATPHVAGAAAQYLQSNRGASPAQVASILVNRATSNVVSSAGSGSPNKLLYTLFGAPSVTPTPTATPTATPTPKPTNPNAVLNPRFEQGPHNGWTESSTKGHELVTTVRPYQGKYSAQLCGYNNCTDYIAQTVTVPSNAHLTYWWYEVSKESPAQAHDILSVQLFTMGGSLITTLRTRSNTSTLNQWNLDTVNLASYGGQTLQLRFTATSNATLKTRFFVDQVAVQ